LQIKENQVYNSAINMEETAQIQGKIFENGILEKLTKSNPKLTITFYSLLIATFFYLNYRYNTISLEVTLGFYIGGLITWTLMEYILHRFLFHIDEYIPFLKRFHYIIHGIHHEFPKDAERLFMPPVPGTIISFFLFLFWYLFFDLSALAFMAGITNGYLMYSYIHYKVHTKPSNKLLHKLWVHHAKHHYKFPDKAYGVSSPFWDMVFGTMPPKHTNSTSH
jgi:sterol desaturase/sphingolipid hydroxylase (fatty acid hydroxylase superfamily)